MADELPPLTVPDALAWRSWLVQHHARSRGVWLTLAKKGVSRPTSLTQAQALEEALCHGWVDGQLRPGDDATFRRKFTPRRPGSWWSKRNVDLVEHLVRRGRMRATGLAAVAQAKADGRWESAYAGQATIQVPDDLACALRAKPAAEAAFDKLDRANRYAVLYRVATARQAALRVRRIEQLVAMLARGEVIHPAREAPRPRPGGSSS